MTHDLERDVSRETRERLRLFEVELEKWNKVINLVSPASLEGGFDRHVIDSAQLLRAVPDGVKTWLDLGSGGGLPGLVVGLIALEDQKIERLILVDSDRRKCAFLTETARKVGLRLEVRNTRIEQMNPVEADVVSARALAPLPKLLEYCDRHLSTHGRAILPKGASFKNEVEAARKQWLFDLVAIPSMTDESSAILSIVNLRRRGTAEGPK